MQGFQKCINGHFFKEGMDKCPYCPSANSSSNSNVDLNKTQITTDFGEPTTFNVTGEKTEIFNSQIPTDRTEQVVDPTPIQSRQNEQFDRTFIQGMEEVVSSQDGTEIGQQPVGTPRATRKMVGWLVSYTLDEMGIDYRIYEGNNTVGRAHNNSIIIRQDNVISSKHISILCRQNKFWIRDEMSANGTLLNGIDMELDKVFELKDGDIIKMGNTTFKFKSSL
ncbi:MAG: FHA domain-containing protein [Bacteroidetes bacterium]|nr:FHA domain-containing protein [Bacteroidota bacterium]